MSVSKEFVIHHVNVVIQQHSLDKLMENVKTKLTKYKLSEYELNQIGLISCQEFQHDRKLVYVRTLANEFIYIKIRIINPMNKVV